MEPQVKESMDVLWEEMRSWKDQWELFPECEELREIVESFEKIEEDSYEDFFETIMEKGDKIFTLQNTFWVGLNYMFRQDVKGAWQTLARSWAELQV